MTVILLLQTSLLEFHCTSEYLEVQRIRCDVHRAGCSYGVQITDGQRRSVPTELPRILHEEYQEGRGSYQVCQSGRREACHFH